MLEIFRAAFNREQLLVEDRQEQLKNDNWKLKSHDLKTLLGKEITQTAPAAL